MPVKARFFVAALAMLPAILFAETVQPKRKPVAPSAIASATPVPSASVPSGALRLRDLGKGNDAPAQNWLELGSLVTSDTMRTVWVLGVIPKDQSVGRKTVAANWAQVQVDCTGRTVTPVRMALVDAEGGIVQQAGPFPPQKQPTAPGTAMGKLVAVVCSPLASTSALASSAAQAVQWTRNPALAPAAAPKPVPKALAVAGTELPSAPVPVPVPVGKLKLVDHAHLSTKPTWTPFKEYAHLPEGSFGSEVWTLQVNAVDRPLKKRSGEMMQVRAVWFNWGANCKTRELKLRHIAAVDPKGETYTFGQSGFPPQEQQEVVDEDDVARPLIKISIPKRDDARWMFEKLCPSYEDATLGLFGIGKLEPIEYSSATAAIAAARRGKALTPADRKAAVRCMALSKEVGRVSAELEKRAPKLNRQRTVTGNAQAEYYAAARAVQQRTDLFGHIQQSLGGDFAKLNEEVAAATPALAGLINRALSGEGAEVPSSELNKCLVDLPLGLLPGQFQ